MTREESIKLLKETIERLSAPNGYLWPDERKVLLDVFSVLRGPAPDPDTGLVPCGCGGSAAYHISYDDENWSTTVKVACNKCLIHVIFSALYELRGAEALADDAKNAWNTAMSGRVEGKRMTQDENAVKHNHNFDFRTLPPKPAQAETPKEAGWVRTADRLPTEADAGVDEKILTIYDDGETRVMGTDYWAYVAMVPEMFPYWLPVPKLPEVEG